jgi:hypothetical protein
LGSWAPNGVETARLPFPAFSRPFERAIVASEVEGSCTIRLTSGGRIDRLVGRVNRRDDYGQLLARGQVAHSVEDVDDVEAWRAEIKRKARADRIKVRTGVEDGLVWALRMRAGNAELLAAASRYRDLLSRAAPLAVELWHEPHVALRDGEEVVCTCGRCSALGYADAAEGVIGGALFEDECPNDEPPAITAVAMLHVPGSRRPAGR